MGGKNGGLNVCTYCLCVSFSKEHLLLSGNFPDNKCKRLHLVLPSVWTWRWLPILTTAPSWRCHVEQCEAVYLNRLLSRFTSEASSWRYCCVLFDCDRKEAIGEEERLFILNPTGKTSSFATHFNIFKFRGKPSVITFICMHLHILTRPTN